MKKLLGTTAILEEAAATSRIFYISSMITSVVVTGPMLVHVFTNEDVLAAMTAGTGNYFEIMDTVMTVMTTMPPWLTLLSLFATVITIITVFIYCTKIERRRLFTLGFMKKGAVTEYLIGLLIGFVLFGGAYGIILLTGQAKLVGFNVHFSIGSFLLFFLGFMIQGMSEEVLVRGYYFISAGIKNLPLALFASSAIFALLHIFNPGISLLALLNLFLFGVFAALYFLRRGSIWGIGAIHTIWNFAQGNVFGCSVSGTGNGTSIFETSYVEGSTLFNGGAFGPEGGLGVTIVLTIGIVILLFMKNRKIDIPAK